MGNRFGRPLFDRFNIRRKPIVVTEKDLNTYDCPACNGDGKKLLTDLDPFRSHSERAWQCHLCGGVGFFTCTQRAFLFFREKFGSNNKIHIVGKV